MNPFRRGLILALLFAVTAVAVAQWGGRRRDRGYYDNIRTAREVPSNSTGTPIWENPPAFKADTFTFARIRYDRGGWGYGRGGWATDLPDSDLNLSYRLQQMTSMRVDPDGRVIRLTDPELADFPFIYIVEPGGLSFSEEEAIALRAYLLNGGFIMFDDFWGEDEWENLETEMKAVFRDREFFELPLTHELYQRPFLIKEKGQVPAVDQGIASEFGAPTWERYDAQEVHHRGIVDDQGRLIVLATHNTDNGDGWEREGESDYYFHNFSEKIAYPLGINTLFYVMTH
ncbi:MAG: DUF4159 domain-containing protein [Verrucomicrobiales bacterium]